MKPISIVGIHLSGANTPRTALVHLNAKANAKAKSLEIYERIGSVGRVFSDERILQILSKLGPIDQLLVDCPLTLPPCIRCQLNQCPGQTFCPDISVAMMLKASTKNRTISGASRRKYINPQSQRLFDVLAFLPEFDDQFAERPLEQTFNSQMMPLTHRARALQKRLFHFSENLELKETSITQTLIRLKSQFGVAENTSIKFQDFEKGNAIRQQWTQSLVSFCKIDLSDVVKLKIIKNADLFKAFVCTVMGLLVHQNQTTTPPQNFIPDEGWVYLPEARQ